MIIQHLTSDVLHLTPALLLTKAYAWFLSAEGWVR